MANIFSRFFSSNKTKYATSRGDNANTIATSTSRKTKTKLEISGGFGSIPRRTLNQLGLTENQLNRYTPQQLIEILADTHPDVSFAVWNFLRTCDSGYTIHITRPNGSTYRSAERAINNFLNQMSAVNYERFEQSGGLDRVIIQLLQSIVIHGACSAELILTGDDLDPADIIPVDPTTIEFKRENGRNVPYQGDVKLDVPTFFYEGLDQFIDNPYGRSPIISSIQAVFFQLQILNDLKQVIHNQGYPRIDIKVLEQLILERMPPYIRNNEEKKKKYLQDQLDSVVSMYEGLEPDDAFVHYDSVGIGVVETKGGAVLDPQRLMQIIDSQLVTSLKTLSTVLGRRATGNTESFAKIEVKLYIEGVKAIQRVVEIIITRILTIVLNYLGYQGIIEFKFNPVDIRTDLEQEQFLQIKILNQIAMRDQGWISDEEASRNITGHAPTGEPSSNPSMPDANPNPDEVGPNDPVNQP
jgi:hypothetical protein